MRGAHDFAEGLADAEEFHAPAGPDARAATTPATPTEAERRAPRHRTLAIQRMVRALREWQRGRGRPHFRQDAGASMERVVQIDYSFYGSDSGYLL